MRGSDWCGSIFTHRERIFENLGAWNVNLTKDEFAALEAALKQIPVHGHRGFVEQQGSGMRNWNRKSEA